MLVYRYLITSFVCSAVNRWVWLIPAGGLGLLDWGKRMKQKLVLTRQQQGLSTRCDRIQVLELYFDQMPRADHVQKSQRSCVQNCHQNRPQVRRFCALSRSDDYKTEYKVLGLLVIKFEFGVYTVCFRSPSQVATVSLVILWWVLLLPQIYILLTSTVWLIHCGGV